VVDNNVNSEILMELNACEDILPIGEENQNQNAKNIGNFLILLKPHNNWYSFERY
jgi:hypothetical protein